MRSLSLEKRGAIAHLALKRPEKQNAIDGAMLRELADACQSLAEDEAVRVVVVSGEGPVFSRGWDWEALAGDDLLPAAGRGGMVSDPFGCLAEMSRPVVCALTGDALSAGLELALACDVRIAAEGAEFGLPETAMGMVPMGGGSQRLARLVGRGKALEMILTAEPIDAAEALRVGLVNAVLPREKVVAEAEEIARRVAERGPLAVRYAKEAVLRGMEMPLEQGLRYETDLTVIIQTTEDRAEGVRAFLEKRKPEFRGR
ncbi:MAG: enoyl-CoA hydratase-related protein [Dehalococcoidia bacterium]